MSLARCAKENKGNICPQLLPPRRTSVNTRVSCVFGPLILALFSHEKGSEFSIFELQVSIAERIGGTEVPLSKLVEGRGLRVESGTECGLTALVIALVFIFACHFTKGGVTNLDTPPKKIEGILIRTITEP